MGQRLPMVLEKSTIIIVLITVEKQARISVSIPLTDSQVDGSLSDNTSIDSVVSHYRNGKMNGKKSHVCN